MLKIRINTINSAFQECREMECARILREIADKIEIEKDIVSGILRDIYGNTVGDFRFIGK